MRSRLWLAALALSVAVLAGAGAAFMLGRDRLYDPNFDTRVVAPAYVSQHPIILYDEGHLNTHTSHGAYRPFVELLRSDGYDVRILRGAFTPDALAQASIIVIVCARGANDANDASAFAPAEIETIDHWVRAGGSLLLVTDHWPYGSAARSLAQAFQIDMNAGYVEDGENFERTLEPSHIVFARDNASLGDHPIIRGRNPSEEITRVLTFTGQSLSGPSGTTALLKLSPTALDRPPSTPLVRRNGGDVRVFMEYGAPVSAAGRTQGLAVEAGRGRLVVLGEAGMLRANRDRRGNNVGMNFAGYDNRQLALNIMHWLSRAT